MIATFIENILVPLLIGITVLNFMVNTFVNIIEFLKK